MRRCCAENRAICNRCAGPPCSAARARATAVSRRRRPARAPGFAASTSRHALTPRVRRGRPLLKTIVALVQVLDEILNLRRREIFLRRVAAALDLMLERVERADDSFGAR